MGEEFRRAFETGALACGDCISEVFCVPTDDDRGEQVKACDAEVLALSGAVADFTLTPDAQGALQRVVRFALVEAEIGPALHIDIEGPFDNEQCPFDPSDFTQSDCQIVLTRARG